MHNKDNSTIHFATKAVAEENVDFDKIAENEDGNSSNEFFDRLEKEVNGAVYDETSPTDNTVGEIEIDNSSVQDPASQTNEVVDYKAALEIMETRYQDSSKEAISLAKKTKELSSYIEQHSPIIDAMREDPQLVHHMTDYLKNGKKEQSIAERFNLPEDFVFDMDEAMSDPHSDSAKVFSSAVDERATRITDNRQTQTLQDLQLDKQREDLKSKYNIEDKDVDDLLDWSKSKQMELEDIYVLRNQSSRDTKIVNNTIKEAKEQSVKVAQNIKSLASKGSAEEIDVSPDRKLFDAILESSNSKDYFSADKKI